MTYISSPLNYTGGKFKLLPSILPLFPPQINTFVDLFCGGCNVGINVSADSVIFNDKLVILTKLMVYLRDNDLEETIQNIKRIITDNNLSKTREFGYSHYNCDSSKGLGNYNRPYYLQLREKFNQYTERDIDFYPTLYVLIVYAFNNQIRFNSNGEYNLPVGKRDFNEKMENKLRRFIQNVQNKNCEFTSYDFRDFDYDSLTANDFVYVDPPYLITCATYNEGGGWTEDLEYNLYSILDDLNKRKIRFALSNVLSSKGKVNQILAQWLQDNPNYVCRHFNKSYSNSNYQTKNGKSDEVFITNY